MNVACWQVDCAYNENGWCIAKTISVDEDGQCEKYKCYLDLPTWKTPFWKRMLDKDNNCLCCVQYYGKEIEIEGRKFFAESRSEYADLTDEITGMRSGTIAFIEDNFDKVIEAANKVDVPLSELPIAIYDEVKRVFTYETKGGAK